MSHYFAVVVVPDRDDVEQAVEAAMKPYNEDDHPRKGWWDWWVIGGRWTGIWSEYDPVNDPANWEICRICQGTGLRNDPLGRAARAKNPGTCNGCVMSNEGTAVPAGMQIKMAADWVKHEQDVIPVRQALLMAQVPYTVLTSNGPRHRSTWTGKAFVDTPDWDEVYRAAIRPYDADHFAVVVDYHS